MRRVTHVSAFPPRCVREMVSQPGSTTVSTRNWGQRPRVRDTQTRRSTEQAIHQIEMPSNSLRWKDVGRNRGGANAGPLCKKSLAMRTFGRRKFGGRGQSHDALRRIARARVAKVTESIEGKKDCICPGELMHLKSEAKLKESPEESSAGCSLDFYLTWRR